MVALQKICLAPLTGTFDELGEDLEGLLANNKRWADFISKHRPSYFEKMAAAQKPKIVWFGCSDSRVPAEIVVQMDPGEIFVHRNIANHTQFVPVWLSD
ncbi:8395_t:CDS:2, partial [Ambispora gerdemannii]